MKKVFHKTVSFIMAFVVLFSTLSFTVDMHYCGDTLVDTAIFNKAKTCGMEMQKTTSSSECSITKKNCCSDQQLVVDGQDELQITLDTISFERQIFIATFLHTYINFLEENKNISSYKDYKPPIVIRQIYKIDESYLI